MSSSTEIAKAINFYGYDVEAQHELGLTPEQWQRVETMIYTVADAVALTAELNKLKETLACAQAVKSTLQ